MRDVRSILTEELKKEFLDRLSELTLGEEWPRAGGLESLDGGLEGMGYTADSVRKALHQVEETPGARLPGELEAIILEFGRPAFLVRNDTFALEDTPSSSETVNETVTARKAQIDGAIPRVGRIDLRDHAKSWVGTGWIVAPGVLVTNRHVAREFAEPDGTGFAFHQSVDAREAEAELDTYREHRASTKSVFSLPEVRWIEPNKAGHHDVAFLRIHETGKKGQKQPAPLELASDEEYAEVPVGRWVAIIGYPAFSIFNSASDQQRIFRGVYEVKRMQPGVVVSKSELQLTHDASTLGGNSGSVVLDLETGKALALHFGGLERQTNWAVPAPAVRKLLQEKLGVDV